MATPQLVNDERNRKYHLNQCALFKTTSKSRLAKLFGLDSKELVNMGNAKHKYKVFKRPEEICQFTGKKTKARWVQEPVHSLKVVQRRLLKLLSRVVLPEYCHGATPGRSYRSNAVAHVFANEVATYDIQAFFPSTSKSRIFNFFHEDLLCVSDVANLLANLCCYDGPPPSDALVSPNLSELPTSAPGSQHLSVLPTGAPISPILSFFANRALFDELSALAKTHELIFSLYIDDMTFSGLRVPRSLDTFVDRIVSKHGHQLSTLKTKRFGSESAKHVTGVVLHAGKIKVPHARFKKARAINLALRNAKCNVEKLGLVRRLAGLLGEAAFLDPSYRLWALRSYAHLAALNQQVRSIAAMGSKMDAIGSALPTPHLTLCLE